MRPGSAKLVEDHVVPETDIGIGVADLKTSETDVASRQVFGCFWPVGCRPIARDRG